MPWDLFELYSTGGWLINCVNWSCWSWPWPKSSFSSDSSKGESRGSGEKSAKMATFQNPIFHRILYNFLPNRSSKFTVPTLSMCFTTIRIRMRSRNLSKSKIPLAWKLDTTDEIGNPKKLRFNFCFCCELPWIASSQGFHDFSVKSHNYSQKEPKTREFALKLYGTSFSWKQVNKFLLIGKFDRFEAFTSHFYTF